MCDIFTADPFSIFYKLTFYPKKECTMESMMAMMQISFCLVINLYLIY